MSIFNQVRKLCAIFFPGDMMKKLSSAAQLSKIYTNHSIRSTSITILNEAGFQGRHIVKISGHKNESSLKSYSHRIGENVYRDMSETLSSAAGQSSNALVPFNTESGNVNPSTSNDNIEQQFQSSELDALLSGDILPYISENLPAVSSDGQQALSLPPAASSYMSQTQAVSLPAANGCMSVVSKELSMTRVNPQSMLHQVVPPRANNMSFQIQNCVVNFNCAPSAN